jgi:hypothetical protein
MGGLPLGSPWPIENSCDVLMRGLGGRRGEVGSRWLQGRGRRGSVEEAAVPKSWPLLQAWSERHHAGRAVAVGWPSTGRAVFSYQPRYRSDAGRLAEFRHTIGYAATPASMAIVWISSRSGPRPVVRWPLMPTDRGERSGGARTYWPAVSRAASSLASF